MASLIGIAPNLRTILAAHVALKLVDRCGLRSPNDGQRHGLMGIAAEATDFEIAKASIEGLAECRRRLGRSLVPEHPLVPCNAGQPVRFLARLSGAPVRGADRCAEDALA